MTGAEEAESAREQVAVAAMGANGPSSPSFAVRVLGPRHHLSGFGVEIQPLTLFSDTEDEAFRQGSLLRKWQLARAARARLLERVEMLSSDTKCVFIQRQADIFAPLSVERRALDSRRLVYDVDDAIWLDSRRANGSAFAFMKGSRRKVEWLARRADHVIAGNDYLADYLGRFARHLTVVPSLVDVADYPLRVHQDGPALTVGWIGSRTTAPYLDAVFPALERVAQRLKPRRVLLLTVGASTQPPLGVDYEALPWTPENQRLALERIDIGIMPQPRRAWVLGKCGYKALQYMASGIPVVADDVGVAAGAIGDAGRVVGKRESWVEALLNLATDAKARTELGTRGRRRVACKYSVERWAPELAGVLRGA